MTELETLRLIISEETDVEPEAINEGTKLFDDLHLDRISFLQILMAMEVEYEVEFDPSDIDGIRTVGDILSFVTGDDEYENSYDTKY